MCQLKAQLALIYCQWLPPTGNPFLPYIIELAFGTPNKLYPPFFNWKFYFKNRRILKPRSMFPFLWQNIINLIFKLHFCYPLYPPSLFVVLIRLVHSVDLCKPAQAGENCLATNHRIPFSPCLIFLLQWLTFYWVWIQFKSFWESIETDNFYCRVAKSSHRKFCCEFFTQISQCFHAHFRLYWADHSDLGITGKIFFSCRT